MKYDIHMDESIILNYVKKYEPETYANILKDEQVKKRYEEIEQQKKKKKKEKK
jgi:hypothetical protein